MTKHHLEFPWALQNSKRLLQTSRVLQSESCARAPGEFPLRNTDARGRDGKPKARERQWSLSVSQLEGSCWSSQVWTRREMQEPLLCKSLIFSWGTTFLVEVRVDEANFKHQAKKNGTQFTISKSIHCEAWIGFVGWARSVTITCKAYSPGVSAAPSRIELAADR